MSQSKAERDRAEQGRSDFFEVCADIARSHARLSGAPAPDIRSNDTVRITSGEHAGKLAHFVMFDRDSGEACVQVQGDDGRWCPSFLVSPSAIEECPDINVRVTSREPGYNHVRLTGTCGPAVTVEDIMRRFYHEYFGGRDAWVDSGRWGCVVHID